MFLASSLLFFSFFEIVIFRELFSSKEFNSSSSKSEILFFLKISSAEAFFELINETECLSMNVIVVCLKNILLAIEKADNIKINIITKTIHFLINFFNLSLTSKLNNIIHVF